MAGCSSIANYSNPIHTSRGPCFSNEGFDKTGICPTFRNSDSSLGWVQKIYISDKFSSDANAAGPGPTLRTSDPEHVHVISVSKEFQGHNFRNTAYYNPIFKVCNAH